MITEEEINTYLRNPFKRFSTSNFNYGSEYQFLIIDNETHKTYGYKDIKARNDVFILILEKILKEVTA